MVEFWSAISAYKLPLPELNVKDRKGENGAQSMFDQPQASLAAQSDTYGGTRDPRPWAPLLYKMNLAFGKCELFCEVQKCFEGPEILNKSSCLSLPLHCTVFLGRSCCRHQMRGYCAPARVFKPGICEASVSLHIFQIPSVWGSLH